MTKGLNVGKPMGSGHPTGGGTRGNMKVGTDGMTGGVTISPEKYGAGQHPHHRSANEPVGVHPLGTGKHPRLLHG